MKKNSLRGFAWFAGLALLVQGLAACSTTDSPMAPTSDDDAAIQKANMVDDGNGGGGSVDDPAQGTDEQDYVGDGRGKTPSSPDRGGDPTQG